MLEPGKKYVTQSEEIVGPMEKEPDPRGNFYSETHPFTFRGRTWREDGKYDIDGKPHPNDIVAEFITAPEPATPDPEPPRSLEHEIRCLLNSFSRENKSNTPDFILAEYMMTCLSAFEQASNHREMWYGRSLQIGGEGHIVTEQVGDIPDPPGLITEVQLTPVRLSGEDLVEIQQETIRDWEGGADPADGEGVSVCIVTFYESLPPLNNLLAPIAWTQEISPSRIATGRSRIIVIMNGKITSDSTHSVDDGE